MISQDTERRSGRKRLRWGERTVEIEIVKEDGFRLRTRGREREKKRFRTMIQKT